MKATANPKVATPHDGPGDPERALCTASPCDGPVEVVAA